MGDKKIIYLSDAIATTQSRNDFYHDDMFNESVFVLLLNKPDFIDSYDYREFNGLTIGRMAEILGKYKSAVIKAEITYYREMKNSPRDPLSIRKKR